jgi:hypothetical protein
MSGQIMPLKPEDIEIGACYKNKEQSVRWAWNAHVPLR